jgi:hypothetical protein
MLCVGDSSRRCPADDRSEHRLRVERREQVNGVIKPALLSGQLTVGSFVASFLKHARAATVP